MSLAPLALIVAHAHNRVIGANNDLPWHYSEDLKHFKETTLGHAMIMGRLSCEALPKALPKRRNLVVTRQADYQRDGFECFTDLDAAIAAARDTDEEPFIIGGGQIYTLALPQITKMYITEIDKAVDGDAYFPAYDSADWNEVERRESGDLTFRCLVRK